MNINKFILNWIYMRRVEVFFIGVLFLGSFLVFKNSSAANTDIVINEIGAYPTSTHEWIEVWNKGNNPVDLSGWKFWENNTNHSLSVSTTDSVVSPNEYAVIVQDADKFILDYPGFSGSIFDSFWVTLSESGENIGLKDSSGNFIEQFSYVSSSKHSLERRDPFLADYSSANWQENLTGNTVGAINSNFFINTTTTTSSVDNGGSTATSTDLSGSSTVSVVWSNLKINEFVSDPDSGNEWVELFNPTTSSLDVAGGYICDSRNTTSTCKVIGGIILANDWLKIDLLTGSYLNNTGDSVILKNPDGEIVDQIDYAGNNAPDKNQALARVDDGVDSDSENDWAITIQPTPGAENVITAPVIAQAQSQAGSGGGGGGFLPAIREVATTTIKKVLGNKIFANKEKPVGLLWKIKYDTRLRQNKEGVFDVSKTVDPRGGRIEYAWNFNGAIVSGTSVNFAFATSGINEIVLRATSTAGTVDEKKINVMVYPAAETAGSGIIFSELLPRTNPSENEYIQLKNIADHSVNISNWKIVYKNDVYEIPTNTTFLSNDYLTFYQVVTGLSLNNSGGQILLLNQDNILMDEVGYDKADENIKYSFDGQKWNWALSTSSVKTVVAKTNNVPKKFSGRFFTKIIDARTGQKGDWAKVKGVVSVLPGVFGSQYFYLTDGNSGIEVYQNKKDFPPLQIGDLAQVYGSISESNGIKRINVKNKYDIDILSINNVVSSTQLNVDEVDENLVGGLVSFQGEITDLKSSFMYVDNGAGEQIVYFKQGANIDKQKLKKGENVKVIGVLEQAKTGWQIWPRSNDDIEYLGMAKDLIAEEKMNSSTGTRSKYVTATVGGVVTLILGFLLRARGIFLKKATEVIVGFVKKDKNLG